MQIDVGYFYFVKDDFFDIINDPELMRNKKKMELKDHVIFVLKVKENDKIIWFIPVSTKVDKYKKIYENKIQNK